MKLSLALITMSLPSGGTCKFLNPADTPPSPQVDSWFPVQKYTLHSDTTGDLVFLAINLVLANSLKPTSWLIIHHIEWPTGSILVDFLDFYWCFLIVESKLNIVNLVPIL